MLQKHEETERGGLQEAGREGFEAISGPKVGEIETWRGHVQVLPARHRDVAVQVHGTRPRREGGLRGTHVRLRDVAVHRAGGGVGGVADDHVAVEGGRAAGARRAHGEGRGVCHGDRAVERHGATARGEVVGARHRGVTVQGHEAGAAGEGGRAAQVKVP